MNRYSFAALVLIVAGMVGSGFARAAGNTEVKEARFAVVVRDGKEVITVQIGGLSVEAGELVVKTSSNKTSVVRAVNGLIEMRSGSSVATAKSISIFLDK